MATLSATTATNDLSGERRTWSEQRPPRQGLVGGATGARQLETRGRRLGSAACGWLEGGSWVAHHHAILEEHESQRLQDTRDEPVQGGTPSAYPRSALGRRAAGEPSAPRSERRLSVRQRVSTEVMRGSCARPGGLAGTAAFAEAHR